MENKVVYILHLEIRIEQESTIEICILCSTWHCIMNDDHFIIVNNLSHFFLLQANIVELCRHQFSEAENHVYLS